MNIVNALFEHIICVLDNHMTFVVSLIANEAFQVASIIEKLSPLRKDIKTI